MNSPTESSPLSISVNSDDNDGSSSSTDIEDLLDPRSSKFSAQLSLLCQQSPLSLPCPEAPSYLNVIELERAIPDPRKEPIFESCLKTSKAKLDNVKRNISKDNQQQSEQPQKGNPNQSSTSSYKTRQAQMQATRLKQQQQNKNEDNSQPSTSSTSSASVQISTLQIPSTSKQQQQQVVVEKTTNPQTLIYPIPGRKFLPHQLPVYRPKKTHPNILTEMENVQGPLKAIKDAMTCRKRVKIWTKGNKNSSGIRGFCTGIVLGFDKHWNLILWGVDEIFQRKRSFTSMSKSDQDKSQYNEEKNQCNTILHTIKTPQTAKQSSSSSIKTLLSGDSSSQTPILIEGPDALLTCRLHLEALTLNSKIKVDPRYKKNTRDKHKTTSVSDKVVSTNSSGHHHHVPSEMISKNNNITKSQLRKKHVKVFDIPRTDPFGYSILAQSKNWEIIHRTQKQLFLMGNLVVFIETNPLSL